MGELFSLLGKAHTLALLRLFYEADGPLRFKDLQAELSLSPNTLSDRLRELTDTGLIERTAYNEIPPRVDYTPTQKTADLCDVFTALNAWAARHTLKAESPPGLARSEA